MRVLFLMLVLWPMVVRAEDRLVTPSEFEALVTGQTLTYSTGGQIYGAEEYFEDRRVMWSYLDGDCAEGEWYAEGTQICFVYEHLTSPQCWQFYDRAGKLMARFENNPAATELYALGWTNEPLVCLGPEVGV